MLCRRLLLIILFLFSKLSHFFPSFINWLKVQMLFSKYVPSFLPFVILFSFYFLILYDPIISFLFLRELFKFFKDVTILMRKVIFIRFFMHFWIFNFIFKINILWVIHGKVCTRLRHILLCFYSFLKDLLLLIEPF